MKKTLLGLLFCAVSCPSHGSMVWDAHVHWNPLMNPGLVAQDLKESIQTGQVRGGLLISPGYLENREASGRGWNTQTSNILGSFASDFQGLCGISLDWTDLKTEAKRCLSLPKMIGLKIHMTGGAVDRSIEQFYGAISGLLKVAQPKVVLIHVLWRGRTAFQSGRAPDKQEVLSEQKEIDALLALTAQHRNIHFIVAHSAFGKRSADHLARRIHEESSLKENLWVDVSWVLSNGLDFANYFSLWKALGWERVLYGSDAEVNGRVDYTVQLRVDLQKIRKELIQLQGSEGLFVAKGLERVLSRERAPDWKKGLEP